MTPDSLSSPEQHGTKKPLRPGTWQLNRVAVAQPVTSLDSLTTLKPLPRIRRDFKKWLSSRRVSPARSSRVLPMGSVNDLVRSAGPPGTSVRTRIALSEWYVAAGKVSRPSPVSGPNRNDRDLTPSLSCSAIWFVCTRTISRFTCDIVRGGHSGNTSRVRVCWMSADIHSHQQRLETADSFVAHVVRKRNSRQQGAFPHVRWIDQLSPLGNREERSAGIVVSVHSAPRRTSGTVATSTPGCKGLVSRRDLFEFLRRSFRSTASLQHHSRLSMRTLRILINPQARILPH